MDTKTTYLPGNEKSERNEKKETRKNYCDDQLMPTSIENRRVIANTSIA
jgi:hypothetical protein